MFGRVCVCDLDVFVCRVADWLWLGSANTHIAYTQGLFLATVALLAQPLCSVCLSTDPPQHFHRGKGWTTIHQDIFLFWGQIPPLGSSWRRNGMLEGEITGGTKMEVHKRSGDRVKQRTRKDENQSFYVHPPSSWSHFLPLYTRAHTQSYRYVCVVQSASHCCEHGYRTVTINVPAQSITNLFSPTACHQMWRPSHLLLVLKKEFGAHCYSRHSHVMSAYHPPPHTHTHSIDWLSLKSKTYCRWKSPWRVIPTVQ